MRVPQRFPALKNKQVAAAALVPPYNMLALTQGFNRLADFDQHLPLWMSGTPVATIETIKTKPAMIKSLPRYVVTLHPKLNRGILILLNDGDSFLHGSQKALYHCWFCLYRFYCGYSCA